MMAYFRKPLVMLLIGALLFGFAQPATAVDVSPFELKALDARRAIRRGHIELERTYNELYESGKEVTRLDRRVIYFDGSMIRNDAFKNYNPDSAKVHGRDDYRDVRCYGEKEHISYSDQVLPDGHTIALIVKPVTSVNRDPVPNSRIDPRLIGMVPISTANYPHHNLESVVGRPDRRKTSVEDVEWNGDKCKLVRYTRNDGLVAKMWICPDKAFGIEKVQIEAGTSKAHYIDTVECALSKDNPAGIWFPESYTYTQHKDGKLTKKEHTRVNVVSLNKSLPADTFALAGIGVPAGKQVYFEGMHDNGIAVWDGNRIVPLGGQLASTTTEWSGRRIFVLVICAVALIVMVGILLYRHRDNLAALRQ